MHDVKLGQPVVKEVSGQEFFLFFPFSFHLFLRFFLLIPLRLCYLSLSIRILRARCWRNLDVLDVHLYNVTLSLGTIRWQIRWRRNAMAEQAWLFCRFVADTRNFSRVLVLR